MELNYSSSHGSKENQLDKLVSGGRCVMWRTGCLHTGLYEQKGNRQAKESDFVFVSPHLGSFVHGRCCHTGASRVEGHQDSWGIRVFDTQGKAEICFSLENIKGGCNSTFTTYMGAKEKMELGTVRIAQWQSQVASRGILSRSKEKKNHS